MKSLTVFLVLRRFSFSPALAATILFSHRFFDPVTYFESHYRTDEISFCIYNLRSDPLWFCVSYHGTDISAFFATVRCTDLFTDRFADPATYVDSNYRTDKISLGKSNLRSNFLSCWNLSINCWCANL